MNDIGNIQKQVTVRSDIINYNWDDSPTICELNGSKWILGPACDEELNCNDAVAWCKYVGGELPPRDILIHCYLNAAIRPLFPAPYYWSSTECTAIFAWAQYFDNGYQHGSYNKGLTYYVRAVSRLDINNLN